MSESKTPGGTPIVEPPPDGDEAPDLTLRALNQRIRQQEILSELGVMALQGGTLDELLSEAAQLTAAGLEVEFCKVLQYIPEDNRLLLRAGVGWDESLIGSASIGADLASPAGFALRTGKPVISNHLENEQRFRTPELLQQIGIKRAMNVILQGDGRPFGVLEVDSRLENEFVEKDLAFLQGAANILGMAIERERQERRLKGALERQEFLLKEMHHRVKNSLSIVSSMLNMQARDVMSPDLTRHLNDAAYRVRAVARAHDKLFLGTELDTVDVGAYIKSICEDLDASIAHCDLDAELEKGTSMTIDQAISIALVVNELIANAVKYAYKEGERGKIWIKALRDGNVYRISVRDIGVGLVTGAGEKESDRLGMKITTALAQRLDAQIVTHQREPGTEVVLSVPIAASPAVT